MTKTATSGKSLALLGRGLLASGLAAFLMAAPASAELPRDSGAMMAQIRQAIETKDYDILKELVFWKDTGKIKQRIVRFHLYRNLGRQIKSITWEEFPENGMDGVLATGTLKPNMEITNQVRVIFDEAPINDSGKLPTSVFLVGKQGEFYRIGLVNRAGDDDDGD